jgi:hypothetical protein
MEGQGFDKPSPNGFVICFWARDRSAPPLSYSPIR